MKRNFLLTIFIAIFISFRVYAQEKVIRLGTEVWAPFAFKEAEAPTGFDYEIAKAVFSKMGYRLDLQFFPWERLMQIAKANELDGVLDIAKTEERSNFIIFPQENISEYETVFFYLKKSIFVYNGPENLSGKNIGIMRGYVYPKDFLESSQFIRHELTGDHGSERNFKKLLAGYIDLVAENRLVGMNVLKKMNAGSMITYSPKPLGKSKKLYVGFTKKPELVDVAIKFDDELKKFKSTNEYNEILEKYGVTF